MAQKVIKSGDSLAVILPDGIISTLQLSEGSELSLKLDADCRYVQLTVSGNPIPEIDPIFAQQVTEFIEQYRPAPAALHSTI
jgi:antitoxin component of MazEF toxin-antitoxin module